MNRLDIKQNNNKKKNLKKTPNIMGPNPTDS